VKLQQRDRRALLILAAAVVVVLAVRYGLPKDETPAVAPALDSIPAAERRLARLRKIAAEAPALEEAEKALAAQLAQREKGMIQAETSAQAQAQLVTIVRRIAGAQQPPIEIRTPEVGQTRPLGADYAEVSVPVAFTCRIEQLVNLLADLTHQPEWLATSALRITPADAKEKTLNVRLTVSAAAPRKLVPEKREGGLL
jgi:hypothetical protein